MQLPVHWFLNRTSIALLTCDIGILNLTVTVPLTFKKSETKSLLDLSFSRSSRRFTILKSEGEPVYSSLGSAKINFLILLH